VKLLGVLLAFSVRCFWKIERRRWMRRLLGFTAVLIIFGFTWGDAMASSALYGSSPMDTPKVWETPCSSGVSNVWNSVGSTGTPQVCLHPDPPETEGTWDVENSTGTPQVWLHPDPPEAAGVWDFVDPAETPQVWLHPDPHPDPELWDFYDPSEPIELWDFDVSANIPHVW